MKATAIGEPTVKVLAIDTATERCSVALRVDGRTIERSTETPRGHADLVLPMVEEVLREGGLRLQDLDGIAYGRGPGAFTGVRIAVAVVQGLAFGANLPTVGISDLAAIAQQVGKPGDHVLVCMDARMGQVYWAGFTCVNGEWIADASERVDSPEVVTSGIYTVLAGMGFKAYRQQLLARVSGPVIHETVLPRAVEIAVLGEAQLRAGKGRPASEAEPVYVRDQVASVKSP
jgi:tRNA threonylcarbamoyladenosine biosynthesis protein TsaB